MISKFYKLIDLISDISGKKYAFMPNHMSNVGKIALGISGYYKNDEIDIDKLYISAALHDVGKIMISDEIINKVGKLSDDEFKEMKNHSFYGKKVLDVLLGEMLDSKGIGHFVECHHENYNGSGYPNGLKGEEIPLISRILRVSDSIDAMTSITGYSGAMTKNKVINELEKFSGVYYDPLVVIAAVEYLSNEKGCFFDNINGKELFLNAGINIKHIDDNTILNYGGSFQVIKDGESIFILKYEDIKKYEAIDKQIKEATIIITFSKQIIIMTGEICGYSNGNIYINKINKQKIDKYFSMPWDGEGKLEISSKAESINVRIINLGAQSIVLKLNDPNKQSEFYKIQNAKVYINEELEEIRVDIAIDIVILNQFRQNGEITLICEFVDFLSGDRDLLYKLLFRKQTLNRRRC